MVNCCIYQKTKALINNIIETVGHEQKFGINRRVTEFPTRYLFLDNCSKRWTKPKLVTFREDHLSLKGLAY